MIRLFHSQLACVWEATARKLGNVHPWAAFADVEYSHFVVSSLCLNWTAPTLGERILDCIQRTRQTVNTNTNLGMVLLLAPLVEASVEPDMEAATAQVLAKTTVEDARQVYAAIRAANPGGLNRADQQDVHDEPTFTLTEAMRLAAGRDLIARQYANNFADVFGFGMPAFQAAWAKFGFVEAAILECQLRWLAEFPDSLIVRKRGENAAWKVQQQARQVLEQGGIETSAGRAAGVQLDKFLRSDGNKLNPGTTADLIAACLFVALTRGIVLPSSPFSWPLLD